MNSKAYMTKIYTELKNLSLTTKVTLAVISILAIITIGFAVSQVLKGNSAKTVTNSGAESTTSTNSDNDTGTQRADSSQGTQNSKSNDHTEDENDPSSGDATGNEQQSSPSNVSSSPARPTSNPTSSTPSSKPTSVSSAKPARADYNLNTTLHISSIGGMSCSVPTSQVTEQNEADKCDIIPSGCSVYYAIASTSQEAANKAMQKAESSQPAGKYFLPKCGGGSELNEELCQYFDLSCGRW